MTRTNFAVVASLAALTISVISPLLIGYVDRRNIDRVCVSINDEREDVRETITHSANQLGKPGSAGYNYYKANPEELAAAKANTLLQLERWQPLDC